ncbi:MAG: hypothetical protein RLZZ221_1249 [Verrucomicrobiota bacterium]
MCYLRGLVGGIIINDHHFDIILMRRLLRRKEPRNNSTDPFFLVIAWDKHCHLLLFCREWVFHEVLPKNSKTHFLL